METLYISESQKKTSRENALIIFSDEVFFRQDTTLHQTWARRGEQPQIPTTGQRNTQKFFGALNLYEAKLTYQKAKVLNTDTYISFLEYLLKTYSDYKLYIIHDNAKYHKNDYINDWFLENSRDLESCLLPPYSPELNVIEKIWMYVRFNYTHNHYFATRNELLSTVIGAFRSIQRQPEQIYGYLIPFF